MENSVFRKSLVIGIIILFLGASIFPSISGNIDSMNKDVKVSEILILDDNLVGYWNFDEGSGDTAFDSSGNNNHGAISGATWTTDAICNNSLDFDGIDDYIYCGDDSSLNPEDEITIMGFAKPQGFVNDFSGNFFGMDYCGYCTGVWKDAITFAIYDPDADQANENGCVVLFYSGNLPSNDFVHVAFTYSISDRTLRILLNGNQIKELITTGGAGKITYQIDTKVYIGKQWSCNFYGIIDEVYIYKRALNETEIKKYLDNPCEDGARNHPPDTPQRPSGNTIVKPGIEYLYTTVTTDPDGDQVYYLWDWGDGTFSDWIGPYNSGDLANAKHSWAKKIIPIYPVRIRVIAKDIYNAESNWSLYLPIIVPRNKIATNSLIYSLLEWFPNLFPILRLLLQRLGLQ